MQFMKAGPELKDGGQENPSLHRLPKLQHSPRAECPAAARVSNPHRSLADRTSPSELLRTGLLQRDGAKETYEERLLPIARPAIPGRFEEPSPRGTALMFLFGTTTHGGRAALRRICERNQNHASNHG